MSCYWLEKDEPFRLIRGEDKDDVVSPIESIEPCYTNWSCDRSDMSQCGYYRGYDNRIQLIACVWNKNDD
jgi:hypothetical protein